MNAVPSIMNLGSPSPPVVMDPLGFDTDWRFDSAVTKRSMRLRSEVSAPVVNWSMTVLKTSDESRTHV